jgi:transcriptional regulator with XRE-family HTH domain
MSRANFGYILRRLRHDREETLEQVSEATGLSVAMLSRIERGERLPSPDSVEALAKHFELPVDYLMSETIANRMVNRYGEEKSSRAAEHMSREPEMPGLGAEAVSGFDEQVAAAAEPAALRSSRPKPRNYGPFQERDTLAALISMGQTPRRSAAEDERPASAGAPPTRPATASEAVAYAQAPSVSREAGLALIDRITELTVQAIDVLHLLASDSDQGVRTAAAEALKRLTRT